MKIALIGIGGMGMTHYSCYKNIPGAEVIAVADVRTDMAREKTEGKVTVYPGIDELLAKETPDIIDICTPSYMHRDMSVRALEAGYNVLCEKPMSLASGDARAIANAAKRSGKLFMTAHVVRFMTPYMYLKKIVDSGELGGLLRLDMKRRSAYPRWNWEQWMLDLDKSGGTPMDLSIHDLDFVQYMLGEPKEVRGVYHRLNENNDIIVSELVYDGCIVSAEAGWYNYELPFNCSFTAVFQNGILEYRGGEMRKNGEIVELEVGAVSENTGINITGADGYAAEIEYFISCVEKGSAPQIVTPESSFASVSLVERIRENMIEC